MNTKKNADNILIVSITAAVIFGIMFVIITGVAQIQQFENEIERCKSGDEIACLIIREGVRTMTVLVISATRT